MKGEVCARVLFVYVYVYMYMCVVTVFKSGGSYNEEALPKEES